MPSFFSFLVTKRFPSRAQLRDILAQPLSRAGALFYALLLTSAVLIYALIINLHNTLLVTVPAPGGTVTEGVIGAPRTLNPFLAVTDTDRALVELVHAGLFTRQEDGEIIPELAENYEVSPDGRTYTVTLKKDIRWSNNKPVTVEDIMFTVAKMQDATLTPNLASYWQTVTVDSPDTRTVTFTIPQASVSFPERLTFGILPQSVWSDTTNETLLSDWYGTGKISAGAFTLARITYKDGIPHAVRLVRNPHYVLGKPRIKRLNIEIFANQESLSQALRSGSIDYTYALAPQSLVTTPLGRRYHIDPIPTTTDISLYRLNNEPMLASDTFVSILDRFIDRQKIISIVENGYGETSLAAPSSALSLSQAQESLAKAGYRYTESGMLSKGASPVGLSIAIENDPVTLSLARALARELETLGMIVSVKAFDPGVFREEVQNGNYSVILSGARRETLLRYQPVLDLYTETIPLVTKPSLHVAQTNALASPLWRYAQVHTWYARTDRLYPIIAPKNN